MAASTLLIRRWLHRPDMMAVAAAEPQERGANRSELLDVGDLTTGTHLGRRDDHGIDRTLKVDNYQVT